MTPKEWRENKLKFQKEMQKYDSNFVAHEYVYHIATGCYCEITMQNLAGMYVRYEVKGMGFRTHLKYRECILFKNEKEMLVHKLKNA